MKNVTIALDDETHRRARIRAAQMGTSLSALVKNYLQRLGDMSDSPATGPEGVREMPMPYHAQPAATPTATSAAILTPDGKPRKPGALKGKIWVADDFDETPDWLLDAFEGKDSHLPWPGPE